MNLTAPTATPAREFYTRKEFAQLMSYALRTMDRMIAEGRLDVHRYPLPGRARAIVRIPVEEYRRFKEAWIQRANGKPRTSEKRGVAA